MTDLRSAVNPPILLEQHSGGPKTPSEQKESRLRLPKKIHKVWIGRKHGARGRLAQSLRPHVFVKVWNGANGICYFLGYNGGDQSPLHLRLSSIPHETIGLPFSTPA